MVDIATGGKEKKSWMPWKGCPKAMKRCFRDVDYISSPDILLIKGFPGVSVTRSKNLLCNSPFTC